MNREIKFRFWDTKEKRWCANELMAITANGKVLGSAFNIYGNFEGFKEGDSNGILVSQYTGLKDKNGKEIYEGDITKTGVVVFGGGRFFIDGVEKTKPWKWEDLIGGEKDEVIGNIYENPELLK